MWVRGATKRVAYYLGATVSAPSVPCYSLNRFRLETAINCFKIKHWSSTSMAKSRRTRPDISLPAPRPMMDPDSPKSEPRSREFVCLLRSLPILPETPEPIPVPRHTRKGKPLQVQTVYRDRRKLDHVRRARLSMAYFSLWTMQVHIDTFSLEVQQARQ